MRPRDFWYEELKFCGCGIPEEVTALIGDALRLIQARSDAGDKTPYWDSRPDSPHAKANQALLARFGEPYGELYYLTMYLLDAHGLTEHGGGVGGCWLTDKGKELLAAIDIVGWELDEDYNDA